jgi:hypothetical protein
LGRHCTVCFHPRKVEIEECIRSGETLTSIADNFELKIGAVWAHRQNHMKIDPKPLKPQITLRDGMCAEHPNIAAFYHTELRVYICPVCKKILRNVCEGNSEYPI